MSKFAWPNLLAHGSSISVSGSTGISDVGDNGPGPRPRWNEAIEGFVDNGGDGKPFATGLIEGVTNEYVESWPATVGDCRGDWYGTSSTRDVKPAITGGKSGVVALTSRSSILSSSFALLISIGAIGPNLGLVASPDTLLVGVGGICISTIEFTSLNEPATEGALVEFARDNDNSRCPLA